MAVKLLLLLVASAAALSVVESARILAFVPFPAKSHQRIIQPLLKELALKGHQVTCVSPITLDNPPKNYKAIKIEDYLKQIKKEVGLADNNNQREHFISQRSILSVIGMVAFKEIGVSFTEWVFKLKEVQDLIKSDQQFDAIILETTFFQENVIALGHRFNAPVIEFIPAANMLWSSWLLGNPVDPSYIEDAMLPYTDHMTFQERLVNTAMILWTRLVWYNYYMPKFQRIMDELIRYPGWETRPSMMDMISNTSLALVNSHFSVNYPYPMAPHFKEVGGLNIVPPKPLPKDLQEFMDGAKDGVIYFTLGSSIDVSGILGDELKAVFSKVFSELKQRVLWKWETEFPNPPSNVKISKWFPQQDILAHKNIKLFITHGGLLSMTEAVYQGVPTIGIPVLADQYKNVAHMEYNKYGVGLHLNNLTYTSLKWTVNEILSNPIYTENAKKRSELFRDKPETALQTAVFWTEYVIRHKGAHHLRPAIATMPWYQQAMIDVYLALAALVFLPLYIIYKSIRCSCRLLCRLCRSSKKADKQTKKKKTQ